MAFFKASCVLRLAVLGALMAAGAFADAELPVSYGEQTQNSLGPPKPAWSLVAPDTITLDESKKIVVPCKVAYNTPKGQTLFLYLTASFDKQPPSRAPEASASQPICQGTKIALPVPEDANFLILSIDSASGKTLNPAGTRAVFVRIDRSAIPVPAESTPPGPSTPVPQTKTTAASPDSGGKPTSAVPFIVASLGLLIGLAAAGYTYWLQGAVRTALDQLGNRIPQGLESRIRALETFASARPAQPPPAAPPTDLLFRLEALAGRVSQLEAAPPTISAAPEQPQYTASNQIRQVEPEPPRDQKLVKMIEEIEKVKAALENWNRIAPEAADRDIKGDANDLAQLGYRVQLASTFDRTYLEQLLRCSRSAAIKIVFAADTLIDPQRNDFQVQDAVDRIVNAAKLKLVDPPSNSDPRDYGANVLTSTVQAGSGDIHGRVARVERRGLSYNNEIVQNPQVRVYD